MKGSIEMNGNGYDRHLEQIEYRVGELEQQVKDQVWRLEELREEREQLLDVLREITEAHRNACGTTVLTTKAQRVIEDVDTSIQDDGIPYELEIAQIDQWIDATGKPPPI
jgi:chromosome segregation ATPase